MAVLPRDPHQRGVDARVTVLLAGEQVVQAAADQHVLPERHRPVLFDDDLGVAADGDEPLGELLRIAHRRTQGHEGDRVREVDDHLFPDGASEAVGEIVHLVHHDVAETAQRVRAAVEHVAQHLGGHDDDGRLAIDRVIPGEQADVVLAVARDEVAVLLVAQRLDRRCVEALAPQPQRQEDRELPHDRLAGAGRRGDEDALAALQCVARPALEVVEGEGIAGGEIGVRRRVQRSGCHCSIVGAVTGCDGQPRLGPGSAAESGARGGFVIGE